MRLIRAAIAAIALCLLVVGPVAGTGPGASELHATHYYLSLGDSLSMGVQPVGSPTNNQPLPGGYADQLWEKERGQYADLQLVKLGCPGESTTTMIGGGGQCAYDHGSQLNEAVSFLHAHHRFVAFVTIDIGFGDFACMTDISCLGQGYTQIAANLPTILSALRAAAGPDVPIVGTTIYDPFLAYWLAGPQGQQLAYASVYQAVLPLNQMLTATYLAGTAKVADVEGAFFTTEWDPPILTTMGPLPKNVATVCAWSWACVAGNNHANLAGYHVMADAFESALHS